MMHQNACQIDIANSVAILLSNKILSQCTHWPLLLLIIMAMGTTISSELDRIVPKKYKNF